MDEVNNKQLLSPSQNSGIRGHSVKLNHKGIREDKMIFFYIQYAIIFWNSLTQDVVAGYQLGWL